MDKANENRNSMFTGVDQFFIEKADKIKGVPALVRKVSAFHQRCIDIDAKVKELIKNSSGKTDDKDAAEDAMLESTFLVKSYLTSFAEDPVNHAILDIASVPEWKLAHMRENDMKVYATTIYELAVANSEGLVEHGLEPDELPLFKTRIDTFISKLGARAATPGTGKGLRKSVLTLISDASKVLDGIDVSMKKYRTKDSEFYNQYRGVRVVKDVGVRHNPKAQPPNQAQPAATK